MSRCRKHIPVVMDALRGTYCCAECARIGWRSHGQRKLGRPRRINWAGDAWMEMFGGHYANVRCPMCEHDVPRTNLPGHVELCQRTAR